VRFAYDRFGPAVLTWKDCTTPNAYIRRGLFQAVGYHVVVGVALLFWSMIGRPSPVSFWRYTLYATLFMAELVLILTPSTYSLSGLAPTSLPSTAASASASSSSSSAVDLFSLQSTISPFTIFHALLPSQVPYQHVQLLHQLFLFLSVALSRVAPQLFPQEDPRVELVLLDRINALLAHTDRENSIALHTQLQSVSQHDDDEGDNKQGKSSASDSSRVSFAKMRPLEHLPPSLVRSLAAEMEDIIIESNIRKEDVGPLRAAWEAALKQKLEDDLASATVKDEEKEEEKAFASSFHPTLVNEGPEAPDMQQLRNRGKAPIKDER